MYIPILVFWGEEGRNYISKAFSEIFEEVLRKRRKGRRVRILLNICMWKRLPEVDPMDV